MKTKLAGLICLFVLCAQIHVLADNVTVTVNEKIMKAFKEAFPMAEKVNWSETGDRYYVHFKDNSVVSMIEYDLDGNLIASQKFYNDITVLPDQLAWEIQNRFAGKTVFGITELSTDTGTIYFVKLQDVKGWVTVKGSSVGILDSFDKFSK